MAQWVRVLVTKPDDGLSFILGIHMVEGDSCFKLSSGLHICAVACMIAYHCHDKRHHPSEDRCQEEHVVSGIGMCMWGHLP